MTSNQPASPGLDPRAGACNLLEDCVGVQRGDSLLVVVEPPGTRYFDERVAGVIAERARELAVNARILEAPVVAGPEDIPGSVTAAMRDADHTVFLSPLGDQLRFTDTYGTGSKTMCYAFDLEHLGSAFARTPWRLFKTVHDRLLEAMLAARHYHIGCALGTDLQGDVPPPQTNSALTDFTVNFFPMPIFPPLTCAGVSGRLAFDRFLVSTSINSFEGNVLLLDEPVIGRIEQDHIVGFDGPPALVDAVHRQYRRVGAFSGGDSYAVNSWHTGIYPHTFFRGDPYDDVQRWSDIVFASPRYTHFHTCGTSPGNIASSTFDATISFDGVPFWDAGRLVFLERPEMQALLADYPEAPDAYEMCWEIGV